MPTELRKIIHIHLSEGRMWNCHAERNISEGGYAKKKKICFEILMLLQYFKWASFLTKINIEMSPKSPAGWVTLKYESQ